MKEEYVYSTTNFYHGLEPVKDTLKIVKGVSCSQIFKITKTYSRKLVNKQ